MGYEVVEKMPESRHGVPRSEEITEMVQDLLAGKVLRVAVEGELPETVRGRLVARARYRGVRVRARYVRSEGMLYVEQVKS